MHYDMIELFEELRRWRRHHEISIEEAAAMCGLGHKTIWRGETHQMMRPTDRVLAAVHGLVYGPPPAPRWVTYHQLELWRQTHGLTRTELAARIGITRHGYRRLRDVKPIARTRARLAAFWKRATRTTTTRTRKPQRGGAAR